MKVGFIVIGVLVGLSLLGMLWLVLKRPLTLWDWTTRRALLKAGMQKLTIPSEWGPQTVFVGGQGKPLVLLHGAGDHAGTWFRAVSSLVASHRVILLDLLGHGDSAPHTGPLPTADIFGALETVIASQTSDQPCIIGGNSLGAWMAMVYAYRHPEKVERVVAINGGPLLGQPNPEIKLTPTTREEARITMRHLRDAASPRIPDHVLDDTVRRASRGPLARFSATAATMFPWLLTEDQLREMRVPVKLVWGVSDQLMPLSYARRMLQALPNAVLFPVEACGHVPQQEAPDRFLAALGQALNG